MFAFHYVSFSCVHVFLALSNEVSVDLPSHCLLVITHKGRRQWHLGCVANFSCEEVVGCHSVILWPKCLTTLPPNAKLLSVAEFTVRTNTASCRTARMMVRQPQGAGCSIYCRLSFHLINAHFSCILNCVLFGEKSPKNWQIMQSKRNKAFCFSIDITLLNLVAAFSFLWAFACLIGICSELPH